MKKIISAVSLILVFAMLICILSGCNKDNGSLTLKKLMDDGFSETLTHITEEAYYAFYQKENSLDKVYYVALEFDAETFDAINSISYNDPDGDRKYTDILLSLNVLSIEDITSSIPAADTYSIYAGKTLGELEDAGFKYNGSMSDEDKYIFLYTSGDFEYYANVTEGFDVDAAPYSLSDGERGKLKIHSVTLEGISSSVFDVTDENASDAAGYGFTRSIRLISESKTSQISPKNTGEKEDAISIGG